MKALGYIFLVFLIIGCWILWQIVRRASAGAQAIISPERYAIHKVEQMQQDASVARRLLERESEPAEYKGYPTDKWDALIKYDTEISAAAEILRPYGDAWIDQLGRDYFALQEDRSYLPNIVRKLIDEAEDAAKQDKARIEQEAAQRWANAFSHTASGELCTEASLDILRQAERRGYVLTVDDRKIFSARKDGVGTSYLHSNSDIEQFGRYLSTFVQRHKAQ
jgi:hypothetical protein